MLFIYFKDEYDSGEVEKFWMIIYVNSFPDHFMSEIWLTKWHLLDYIFYFLFFSYITES